MAFIAFEGLDGSGKSTLIENLLKFLRVRNISFIATREPGGTALGETLREMILKNQDQPPCPQAELLMYEAIRAQHVHYKIKPELQAGNWVITDRFSASSIAFQAGGRKISEKETYWLNQFATGGVSPDLTVLLDISYSESQKRMSGRGKGTKDRIEQEDQEFHERVRASYLKQAQDDPKKWLVLKAAKKPEDLSRELETHLVHRGFFS